MTGLVWLPWGSSATAGYDTAGREPADIRYVVAEYKGRWIVSLAGENVVLYSSFPTLERAKRAAGDYHEWLVDPRAFDRPPYAVDDGT